VLDTHMSRVHRNCLLSAARDLHEQFRGVFGEETIQALLFSSYAELAARATIDRWLVIGAERFTRQRLRALAHAESHATGKVPPCCSSACITPGARRWPWAGLPTWPKTRPSHGRAAPSPSPWSARRLSPPWQRPESTSPKSSQAVDR
jgi:hypothetical protein